MIDFLGNIQKSPDFYKLSNNKNELLFKTDELIGSGSHATIYSFKLKNNRTKKDDKKLALKIQNYGNPFTLDIHINSAILLALYGFQPKYYNNIFMELGNYPNKSQQREFHPINGNYFKQITINKNIKWLILFNLANMADQTYNFMERKTNGELTKIDINHFNSETRDSNIQNNLIYFNKYEDIFKQNKEIIIKELNKIFNIKEKFLIDLIIFRTGRGCFEISNKILSREINCLSSSYKVVKINDDTSFIKILYKSKENFNKFHLAYNPALSWMLYIFFQKNILNKEQYIECIDKFNEISEKFSKIAKNIEEKDLNDKKVYNEIFGDDKKDKNIKNNKDYDNNYFKKYDINKKIKKRKKTNKNNNIINDLEKNSNNLTKNINDKKDLDIKNISEFNTDINNYEITENIDIKKENIIENKKQNHFCFGFCCGENAIDVID